MKYQREDDQRGNALVEFALVSIVAVPMMFGTLFLGFSMGSNLQAIQITRDVAHMYAKGVDFSAGQSQSVATTLASGYDLSSTGNSVLTLSQIIRVYQADCDGAGFSSGCTNLGLTVFVNRIVLGKASLRASDFGTPNATYLNAQGNLVAANYLKKGDAVATGFSTLLTLGQGQVAYVAEIFLPVPKFPFSGGTGTPGVFARAIF